MGNGGSFVGDAAPGSRTTVQRKFAWQPDRDWRFSGIVLPVQFLDLAGVLRLNEVELQWTVLANKAVERFEVERSIDNVSFVKAGVVEQSAEPNEQLTLGFIDDVTHISNEIIIYRIKVIGKSGEIQYSNIILVRKRLPKSDFNLMPNPARDYATIMINIAESNKLINIRLLDKSGKLIQTQQAKITVGQNMIQLVNLHKYPAGVYWVQITADELFITRKLIIIK